jgi:hypothetical protein
MILNQKAEPFAIGSGLPIQELLEQPGCKHKHFTQIDSAQTLYSTFTAKKTYGKAKNPGATDDVMQGTSINDPSELEYYQCILGPTQAGDQVSTHDCMVKINYKVTWFNPKNLAASY